MVNIQGVNGKIIIAILYVFYCEINGEVKTNLRPNTTLDDVRRARMSKKKTVTNTTQIITKATSESPHFRHSEGGHEKFPSVFGTFVEVEPPIRSYLKVTNNDLDNHTLKNHNRVKNQNKNHNMGINLNTDKDQNTEKIHNMNRNPKDRKKDKDKEHNKDLDNDHNMERDRNKDKYHKTAIVPLKEIFPHIDKEHVKDNDHNIERDRNKNLYHKTTIVSLKENNPHIDKKPVMDNDHNIERDRNKDKYHKTTIVPLKEKNHQMDKEHNMNKDQNMINDRNKDKYYRMAIVPLKEKNHHMDKEHSMDNDHKMERDRNKDKYSKMAIVPLKEKNPQIDKVHDDHNMERDLNKDEYHRTAIIPLKENKLQMDKGHDDHNMERDRNKDEYHKTTIIPLKNNNSHMDKEHDDHNIERDRNTDEYHRTVFIPWKEKNSHMDKELNMASTHNMKENDDMGHDHLSKGITKKKQNSEKYKNKSQGKDVKLERPLRTPQLQAGSTKMQGEPMETKWPRLHHYSTLKKDSNSDAVPPTKSTRMTALYLATKNVNQRLQEKPEIENRPHFISPYSISPQMTRIMKDFSTANATVEEIGRTVEYNKIVVVKITEKKDDTVKFFRAAESKYIDEVPEKRIIFIVHGLSVMGMNKLQSLNSEVNLKIMLSYYLAHLDKFDIFLIPMANPDGYSATYSNSIWNKNVSPQHACPGVFLDRNFDVAWNATRKISSCSQLYPGPKAFSEIESQAVRDVFHYYSHRILAYIHVHAGTYNDKVFKGDAVLYPKGYTEVQSDDDKYIDLKAEIDEAMKNASFQVMSMTVDTLYNWYGKVLGSSVDYAASVYGIPYALEFVMQLYEGGDEDDHKTNEYYAMTEIWSRVIDTTFKNLWKSLHVNEVRRK